MSWLQGGPFLEVSLIIKEDNVRHIISKLTNLNDDVFIKEIQTKYGTGYVGTLSDGTTVVARPGSSTGGATLEINISNSKVYKIRY